MGSRSESRKPYAIINIEDELPVVETDKSDYNSQETDSSVDEVYTVASMRAARLIVEIPGGRTLTFDGAGSEVKVSLKEAEFLLSLKRGRACCGGQQGSPLFTLVGGKLWV
jgi:hypothetical protein